MGVGRGVYVGRQRGEGMAPWKDRVQVQRAVAREGNEEEEEEEERRGRRQESGGQ